MRRLLLVLAALAVSPLAAAQKAPDSYPGCVYNATPPSLGDKQATTIQCDSSGNLKTDGGGSGGAPTPVVPGQLTFLGQQKISAATLAATTALTVPATATIADFYPECATNGTDGQCVRFNPAGATDASAGSGLASQQLLLGYSGGLATIQFILAAGASGASGTIPTLTINYYK